MVLRRCLYIILSVWLINAVVCFHADDSSAPTPTPDHLQYPGENCQEGDTALDFITQLFSDHNNTADNGSDHQPKKFPRKLIIRRLSSFNVQLPTIQSFEKSNVAINLCYTFGKHWLNKLFLPGYYNFLFRYKPF